MDLLFENKNMDQIDQAHRDNALIILPVGILEEHGPHLPVATDNIIAEEVARRLAHRIADRIPVLLLPTVWAGYHGNSVARMPGSVRVKPETLLNYVYDIVESLCCGGFRKIMLINGHGQNPAILEIVCRKITDAYGVCPVMTNWSGMIGKKGYSIRKSRQGGAGGHADEVETSIILALRKELVDMDKAPNEPLQVRTKFVAGDMFPEQEVVKGAYWSTFAVQGTKSGALGDATAATAETGERFLEEALKNYEEFALEYYRFEEK